MVSALLSATTLIAVSAPALAAPFRRWEYSKYWDLQGHRGGRGETVENTLPSFSWGLINGVTSLEMDCGVTKDGEVVVWHDENFVDTKCRDTSPAFEDDPDYPYVGKYIANLTLAQIKTLDCGSLRQVDFPLQDVYAGTKVSTLQEMFDFVKCATDEPVLFNIESKVDGDYHNLTRGPEDFVDAMGTIFYAQGEDVVDRITHQSFDWRSIKLSKEKYPNLRTSALCDDTTIWANHENGTKANLGNPGSGPSNWLAGIDIDKLEGDTVGERVARAAASINADFLSPVATSYASNVTGPGFPGFVAFTNKTMVDTAHSLGLGVKPWTPDVKNLFEYLLDLGVEGVITDFPHEFRRLLEQKGNYALAPKGDTDRILSCLSKHVQVTENRLDGKGYA
ncbi:hypothetical protein L202_05245 [Cryptococcus amylolentus CBS 6039]|uniref:GP-PDE domain-containing protein n=1 Tax=Cryptococcus amylolentus CBS 6039 TaxID=1295533 RepID=A0A1E3HLK8_9TREE|nr:hypothetical protein L202_05245 [Cryptococcus amylolentus CBS 6039]ODN76586.1 hypothetical protein L202_05245 [Cryptococcus amylolentus CBS 6039]